MKNRLEDKEYKKQTIKLALFLGELLVKTGQKPIGLRIAYLGFVNQGAIIISTVLVHQR